VFLSRLGALLARVGFVRVILGLLTGGAPGAARGVARLFGSKVEGVLSRLVGEVQKLPPNSWPIVQACWSQPKCFTAIADHLAGLPSSAREVADRSLGDIPLIVISAAQGWAAQRDVHERLASLSSRGRVVVAKQSGHWAQLDEPEIVVEAIRELVEPREPDWIACHTA
jgi:pimeloyl-ACP methyl ester carboxylesterase